MNVKSSIRKRRHSKDYGAVTKVPRTAVNRPSTHKQRRKFVLPLLVCFRIINALCIKTFFQPDEYFQSLEPAWEIAFGSQSGAWITWEWQHRLRSSLHPVIFGALYLGSAKVMESLAILPQFRATILIIMPKILQGVFAAIGDYFTWKLAERIYGYDSNISWTALLLTIFSPWQWFCSTRTLSNSLEVVLTTVALYLWPWGLPGPLDFDLLESNTTRVRICLTFAGIACILRPTNLLIWVSLVAIIIIRLSLHLSQRVGPDGLNTVISRELLLFCREVMYCAAIVIGVSGVSDRLYYRMWTFPPYQWLNFNITQSLAVFYGTNDWHYYLSQGFPLLLTTYLPFMVQALLPLASIRSGRVVGSGYLNDPSIDLIFVVFTMTTILSLISHKEVRFIYPLLPCLHVLAAPYVRSFFALRFDQSLGQMCSAQLSVKRWRPPLLILLVITNIAIGLYSTQVHQRGVIDVLNFLRHEYEERISEKGLGQGEGPSIHVFDLNNQWSDPSEILAAFLMPCHSTPWRSHLIYPKLQAWALTCEPPLHIPADTPERALYRDEADRFYDDPSLFLKTEMNTTERQWPRYLVGFEGIESILKNYCEAEMPGRKIRERWRGFNSHWHDDSRRRGEVVIWELVDNSQASSYSA